MFLFCRVDRGLSKACGRSRKAQSSISFLYALLLITPITPAINRGPNVSKYSINFSLLIECFGGQYVADKTIGPYFRSIIGAVILLQVCISTCGSGTHWHMPEPQGPKLLGLFKVWVFFRLQRSPSIIYNITHCIHKNPAKELVKRLTTSDYI